MFEEVMVINKRDPSTTFIGCITWRDVESFGLDFSVYGIRASTSLYYDEWKISRNV